MAHISAVVKGNRFHVAREAANRGIPAVFVHESHKETVIHTGPEHVTALGAWLAETDRADIVPGVGFPDGTLLIYSHHDDEVSS